MDHSFEDLQKDWKKAQASQPISDAPSSEIVEKSKREIRGSEKMQTWNLTILSVTLLGLAAFFYFVAPVQETMSRMGAAIMLIGLLVRIVAESISLGKAKQLKMDQSATALNQVAIDYHDYRKKIHGAFTTVILILYVLGILMLVPEFSLYLSSTALLMIGVFSLFGILIVGYSIRKGIRDEMAILNRLKELQQSISE